MRRYSIKRQSILEYLLSTKEHPTAEMIYTALKKEYPSLSLATVYRNLNQLKSDGVVRTVGCVNGQERFDADTTPHTHCVCVKCGKVSDAFEITLPEESDENMKKMSGFTVLRTELTVSGICAECRKKQ